MEPSVQPAGMRAHRPAAAPRCAWLAALVRQKAGHPGDPTLVRDLAPLQAIARLFRYGQTEKTFVYRMYHNGTVQVRSKSARLVQQCAHLTGNERHPACGKCLLADGHPLLHHCGAAPHACCCSTIHTCAT